MKYKVFICDITGDRCDPKEISRQLCSEAINAYLTMEKTAVPGFAEITPISPEDFLTEEKGKPYLKDYPIHFNVSHSGLLWLCMVGEAPCGIDIQQEKDCSFEKIAERHFNEAEQEYVKREGIGGFFRLWTMREAYGKYTGEGFYGSMPSFIGPDGQPVREAEGAFIHEIEIGQGIYCVCCTGGKNDQIEFIG